ncbi:MAG TPA: DNA methyltransferase [Phycisphaerae bacterium]|jgi:DNA modification methylase|nr:DNA methyltransferase [Phycisphaerae bacterium]
MHKPPLHLMTTTLWEYPSQDYGREPHGDKDYVGATPAWVIWQLLSRYTREGDTILDPMCGSGTTIDVATELKRKPLGFDLAPSRKDIQPADARKIPLQKESVDFAFIDPPYSTHVDYSDDPRCIGKLDAGDILETRNSKLETYYSAMALVLAELHRTLKNRRYMALYVSDSFKKGKPFMPIGFELFAILRQHFKPIDIIAVVRHNRTLKRNNWHAAAVEGNYFLRGFNYLFIMKKEER